MKLVRNVFEVDVYGTVVKMTKPTYEKSNDFNDAYEAAVTQKEKSNITLDFLENLGLPKELSKSLECDHMTDIINLVMGSKKN